MVYLDFLEIANGLVIAVVNTISDVNLDEYQLGSKIWSQGDANRCDDDQFHMMIDTWVEIVLSMKVPIHAMKRLQQICAIVYLSGRNLFVNARDGPVQDVLSYADRPIAALQRRDLDCEQLPLWGEDHA